MADWTIEFDTGAGFTTRRWTHFTFRKPLNQIEDAYIEFHAGTTEPVETNEAKITWDKGGPDERVWFRGSIARVERDELSTRMKAWCYDDSYTTYQSTLGSKDDHGLRDYVTATPFTIIQSAGTPKGLLYNGQANLIMAYGTTAPNAITGGNPGNALTFRAHTGINLEHIGRLCEEATHGGGPTFGLEWFVDRTGADAKRFNLVTRRQRAAVYTAESFQIGRDLHRVPRSRDADLEYDRFKVIGMGSGQERIESSWFGTGTREYIFRDKNINTTAAADNLAQRIKDALSNTGTNRFEARTTRHSIATDVGDDVDVVPRGGGGATTYRCLEIRYHSGNRDFTLGLGRRRDFFYTTLRDANRNTEGMAQSAQETDVKPESLQAGVSFAKIRRPSNVTVNAGTSAIILDTDTAGHLAAGALTDLGEAEALLLQVVLDVVTLTRSAGGSHTHDLQNHTHDMQNHTHTYDKADTPTGATDAAGGGAVPEPHTHAITHTPTASGVPSNNTTSGPTPNVTGSASGAPTLGGPFVIQVRFEYDTFPDVVVYQATWPILKAGERFFDFRTYPFAAEGGAGDFTPDRIQVDFINHGDFPITLQGTGTEATSTQVGVWRNALHKHNEV